MSYVGAEILLLNVLLSVISGIIGWVLRAYAERWWFRRGRTAEPADDAGLGEELERARSQLRDLDARLAQMAPERQSLEEALERKVQALQALQADVDASHEALAAAQARLEDLGEPAVDAPPPQPDLGLADTEEASEVEADPIDDPDAEELDTVAFAPVVHADVTHVLTEPAGFPVVVPPVSTLTRPQARERVQVITAAHTTEGTDDLRRIRGIGPRMADQLDELGVVTFRQLVELLESEGELMAKALKSSVARFGKANWTSQARTLHAETHGEELP